MTARMSIKSAGVARFIGRLVQSRFDFTMREERLVKTSSERILRVDLRKSRFER